MRVLHYLRFMRLDQGGPVRAVTDLSRELARAGHRLTIVTQDAGDAPAEWMRPGSNPRVVELGPARLPGELFSAHQIRRLRAAVADQQLVHVHQLWLGTTAQVVGVAHWCGKPYVVSLRGMLDEWCIHQRRVLKRGHLELVGRRLLEGAAFVHCTAEGELRQARQWFPRGCAEVIPNFLDLEPYQELPSAELAVGRFGLRRDVPRLVFLSRLHPKKNVEALLHAAAELVAAGRPHQVLIAGSGDASYRRELGRLATELGLDPWVRFLGFVRGQEKLSLYRAADLFVLPTHQENFGFVLFESLLAETPVVTTYGVDTWPELQASGGAFITDPEGLGDTLRTLLCSRADRSRMGEQAARWVRNYLDRSAVMRQFDDAYQRSVAG